jgi:hypothetical protein
VNATISSKCLLKHFESFVSIYVDFNIKYDVDVEYVKRMFCGEERCAREGKKQRIFGGMSIKLRGRHFGMPLA